MHLKHHLWTSLWEYLGKLFWFVWVEMGLGLGFGWKCLAWWILRITIAYSWFCVCFFDPFGDVPKKMFFQGKKVEENRAGVPKILGWYGFPFPSWKVLRGESPNPPPNKKNSWVFNEVGTFKVGLLILDMFGGSKTTTLLGDFKIMIHTQWFITHPSS